MKVEPYHNKCVREIFRELEEYRPKIKWTVKSLVITIIAFFFNYILYIGIFIYVFLCALQGVFLINSESGASDWIGIAAFLLSLLAIIEKSINFDMGIRYTYYYKFDMIDSLNEIISLLYHNKKYSSKIKVDNVECTEIGKKIYLKITYH